MKPRFEGTLTEMIETIVILFPGSTAWSVARRLSVRSAMLATSHRITGTVSSLLHRMAKRKQLRREVNAKGTWIYFSVNK